MPRSEVLVEPASSSVLQEGWASLFRGVAPREQPVERKDVDGRW